MDKKIAGLLGAAAALTTLGATQANATPAVDQSPTVARSYAELLDPVPNAAAQLKADDAAQANPGLTLAEYVYVYRRHHHHHHHHHHHRRYHRVLPPFIFGYSPRHHHHHHHHHHHRWHEY